MISQKLKTPSQAHAELRRGGITVAHWARTHGVKQGLVYQVLSGKKKGNYGQAHRVAVLLGIKDGTLTS